MGSLGAMKAGSTRPLLPGVRVGDGEAGARGHRGHGALQGPALGHGAAARGRPARRAWATAAARASPRLPGPARFVRSPPPGSRRATSTTSSSRRKHRTTASSSRAWSSSPPSSSPPPAARRRGRPFVTYFNGDHGVSRALPGELAHRPGRAGRGSGTGTSSPRRRPRGTSAPVSVTLLSGARQRPRRGVRRELPGRQRASRPRRSEERQGVPGPLLDASPPPDGATRLPPAAAWPGRTVLAGCTRQGEPPAFESHAATLEEMWTSLTLERPELYPVQRWERFGVALGMPPILARDARLLGRRDAPGPVREPGPRGPTRDARPSTPRSP